MASRAPEVGQLMVVGLPCSAGCGGGFSAAFSVDSDEAEVRAFRQATGSGTLNISSDLDLEAATVSALQADLTGEITTTR